MDKADSCANRVLCWFKASAIAGKEGLAFETNKATKVKFMKDDIIVVSEEFTNVISKSVYTHMFIGLDVEIVYRDN
jgi:hypothetical protein